MNIRAEEIKALILSCLEPSLRSYTPAPNTVPDDLDLRAEGLVDSLGVIRLIAELETRLGFELDFGQLDPEDLTVIGPLSRYIADRARAHYAGLPGGIPRVEAPGP